MDAHKFSNSTVGLFPNLFQKQVIFAFISNLFSSLFFSCVLEALLKPDWLEKG